MQITEKFPIWKIEDSFIINKKGDISLCYELDLPPVFTLSENDYAEINGIWTKCINILSEGYVIHKLDWFYHETKDDPYKIDTMMSNANRHFFQERKILSHRSYLTFSIKSKGAFKRSHSNSILSKKTNFSILEKKEIDFNSFVQKIEQCVAVLKASNYFNLTLLTAADLIGNKKKKGLYQKLLSLDMTVETKSDILFNPQFKVGKKYVNLYSISDADQLPNNLAYCAADKNYGTATHSLHQSFVYPLGLPIKQDHILHQCLFIDDFNKTMKQLEQKQKRLKSFSLYSSANKIREEEIGLFLKTCHEEHLNPVHFHMNMLLWDEEEDKLKEGHLETISAFQKMGCKPKIVNLGHDNLFWSGIPGNATDIPQTEQCLMLDWQAAAFTYLETPTKTAIGYHGIKLSNRVSGSPLLVDLSEEPMEKGLIKNRNKIFVGDSGGGKSFFMNHLLRHYAEQQAHIMIVDIGHSYKRLCEINDGLYFTYSDKMGINPFWIDLSETIDIEKKESLLTLLFTLWKKSPGDKSQTEYSLLSNALNQFYEQQQVLFKAGEDPIPTFNDFYDYMIGPFKDQLNKDNLNNVEYFNVKDFQICLQKFYRGGEYENLLNSTTHTDLRSKRFIVFELDSIAEHPVLFPIVALIIMETFINKMRNLKGVKKVIVIEEAWKAIAKEGFDSFIKYLYKTCRKFYGEPIVVTQELEDLLENPVVKNTIIKQSDTLFVADLGKNKPYIDKLQQILGFSEHEKNLVLSLNKNNEAGKKYKEIFIRQCDIANIYRVEVSPTEYFAYTTEEKESHQIYEMIEKYDDMDYALRNYSLLKTAMTN